MNSRHKQTLPGTAAAVAGEPVRLRAHAGPMRPPSLPIIVLPITRWEYKDIYEKDENFDIVYANGEPVVSDQWVIVYFLTPDGREIEGEFDREPFDKFLFPALFQASMTFWESLSPRDPLYKKRKDILDDLMELKKRFDL
jgi:hypothetical protein